MEPQNTKPEIPAVSNGQQVQPTPKRSTLIDAAKNIPTAYTIDPDPMNLL